MQTENSKRILIIDDVPAIRELFKHYLIIDNYDVLEADSGEAGLEMAAQHEFDGILLDLNMPGLSGIEVCRRLRTLDKYQFTPILVITAADKTTILSQAFEAGCDDYITKPINKFVLRSRLKAHIQRVELYRQHERMRTLVNRYVSPMTQDMIEQYVASGKTPRPERREVCVLFTDIRGFTELAQQLEPEELFKLLNEHLARQAELVYQHGGYVDKYGGDGITAIFEGEGKEQRSCLCAQGIITHAQDLIIKKQNHLFAVSCGINKGEVILGDIGTAEHLHYTVVGATVNLAARLSSCAGPISIIAAENVYAVAKNDPRLLFLPREDIRVKGLENPVTVYELTPLLQAPQRNS
ncbi:MAG: adenylate/guanylate cyclase domain-containing protein [Gammaproteobacteria bacterium]